MRFLNDLSHKPKGVRERVDLRRPVGLFVEKGKCGPYVHQLYNVTYSDGSSDVVVGRTIFAWPGIRPTNMTKAEKQLDKETIRTDLNDNMEAVAMLSERLADAYWWLDNPKPKKKPKAKK